MFAFDSLTLIAISKILARKKQRLFPLFFRNFIWLTLGIFLIYLGINLFVVQPHVFYPGFEINIPQGYEIHGIDVSRYQDIINWQEVSDMEVKGIRIGFTFIKATEGLTLVDKQFRRNWAGAEKVKMPKGAYHFFIPAKNPKAQAQNFIGIVSLQQGDLPPVLDVEIGSHITVEKMQANVKTWLQIIEKHYGVIPMIYTNISFYEKYFSVGFERYPVWIAHYLQPDKPGLETKWSFWQHSENGRINGIRTPVDFNVFSGDSTAFRKMLLP